MYGDNSKIRIGRYCYIGRGTELRPASHTVESEGSKSIRYLPLIVGANTSIGPNTKSEAAAIGSSVTVGQSCTLGNRCIIKDCVYVEDEAVIPDDMVIPPFSVVSGRPAQILRDDVMPESCAVVIPESRVEAFSQFVKRLDG